MAKRYYEIGLMGKSKMTTDAPHDYETLDWDVDYDTAKEARREAIRLSKECPFKTYHGQEILAIQITCHSDEEEISSYYIHWSELYENGKMVRRINY